MSASHAEAVRSTPSGAWHVTLWVLQVVIAALFLFAGGLKLAGAPPMVELFAEIGFGQWFRFVTGGLEIVGAVALLVGRLAAYGALLLAGIMVGAVITELALGGPVLLPLLYLVVTGVIAWGRRDRLATLPRR